MIKTYLLLAVIFVVIGFVGGALVALLWMEKEKKTSQGNEKKNHTRPEDSIYLHQRDENLELWLEGKPQRQLKNLNPTQRQTAMELFNLFKKWLEIDDTPEIVEIRVPTAGGESQIDPSTPTKTVHPVETTADLKLDRGPAKEAKPPEVPVVSSKPALSMVEQINEILQLKLVQSSMSDRGIRLEEDPVHGVVVWLGLQKYPGLDSLPDPQVKDLIHSAVSEWERRSST